MNDPGFTQAMSAIAALAILFVGSWLVGKFTA